MPNPPAPSLLSYLDALNPAQREAVETFKGPLLVLAGAGSGKTRVLTTKIAHIILHHKAWPSQVLAVTFTNKAATEMRERVQHLVGNDIEGLWLGTFHRIALRFLRRHGERIGLNPNFTILDGDDQLRLIKQLLKAHHVDEKKYPPRLVLTVISRWKDRALTPEKVSLQEMSSTRGLREDSQPLYLRLYIEYQQNLRTLNAVDFGDLILLTLDLLRDCPDVLAQYKTQFSYILVDEYQDINVAQYLWLRLLGQGKDHICCVGDDDQSIYGWRGAEVENILRFEKDFPGATIIRLEENYRSTPPILAAAAGLIAHNQKRLGKTLKATRVGGEKVHVQGLWNGTEEARWVGQQVEQFQREKHLLSSMAILVRASFQTREFEERFITLGIPYRVVGSLRFYERLEIRDALAYLRVVAQPDDSLAFERIINTPKRGLGATTLQVLHRFARFEHISLVKAAQSLVQTEELKAASRLALKNLLKDLQRWRDDARQLSPGALMAKILDESGYLAFWRQEKSTEAAGRLENLKELMKALEEFDTLQGFLEHVSLVIDTTNASPDDLIPIMTLHTAKGLEFDLLFLTGWEEGVFPHPRTLEESGEAGLEEERRLAYVGLTRAKQRAFISFAWNRRFHQGWQSATPSRFIDELPAPYVERFLGQPSRPREDRVSSVYPQKSFSATASMFRENAPAYTPSFRPGQQVFHEKFGYGQVQAINGESLDIDFACSGSKKVMNRFVKPIS